MDRTFVVCLVILASVGCANSSTAGGVDSGGPSPLVIDSGAHDATHDGTVFIVGGDTGTGMDTGMTMMLVDTGTPADVTAPTDSGADVAVDGASPTDSATPDTGTTTDAPATGDAGSGPTTCAEAHGGYGCCATSTLVYYCGGDSGTTLKSESCTGGKVCVYDTSGRYYHCGAADAGVSANHPAACGAEDAGTTGTDAATTVDAGKDSGASSGDASVPTTCSQANGAIGCCDGRTLYYCMGTTLISRKCIDGNVCGWAPAPEFGYYDCGNLSGEAPGDDPPKACQ